MVTVEEIKKRTFNTKLSDITSKNREYQVSDAQMAPYLEDYADLALEISDIIEDYVEKHQLKPKYEKLEELTQLSSTTIKHTIKRRDRVTRTTLYKLCVGLRMSLDEANELFRKCGGVLKEDCLEDFI
ncbi:MAG: hypothetical protein K6E91_00155, partial [Butyrivibrio sp.]|nr:hypothetical protein [Butyrivibrio sp.]